MTRARGRPTSKRIVISATSWTSTATQTMTLHRLPQHRPLRPSRLQVGKTIAPSHPPLQSLPAHVSSTSTKPWCRPDALPHFAINALYHLSPTLTLMETTQDRLKRPLPTRLFRPCLPPLQSLICISMLTPRTVAIHWQSQMVHLKGPRLVNRPCSRLRAHIQSGLLLCPRTRLRPHRP